VFKFGINNPLTIFFAVNLFNIAEILFLQAMRYVLNHIAVTFIAVVLVFTAGGIGLYQHYCLCSDKSYQTLFLPSNCCDHEAAASHCQPDLSEQDISDCCINKATEEHESGHGCASHKDCCNDEFLFLKTDSFDYSKSTRVTNQIIAAVQVSFNGLNNLAITETKKLGSAGYSDDLPPPLFGKELLFTIRQLKLDFSSV
jgi:hypothetical protein